MPNALQKAFEGCFPSPSLPTSPPNRPYPFLPMARDSDPPPHPCSPETISSIREHLGHWFQENARDYPWRRTRDPYAILVSELMLQQTQITTVLERGYYRRWMERFPDWETLASASETSILKAWEGLGYYNRARNLQRTAHSVILKHGGEFPREVEVARGLPGIGPYTAGAVLSLAYGIPEPAVDGNVSRVLSRLFLVEEAINSSTGQKQLWELARALVSPDDPGGHNSALMELGQSHCRPSNPKCPTCPLEKDCSAFKLELIDRFPIKKPPPPVLEREEFVLLIRRAGRLYLVPETGNRRKGLWRLPEVPPGAVADLTELCNLVYPITRYRVLLRVFEAPPCWQPPVEGSPGEWFTGESPESLPPLGAPYRKVLELSRGMQESLDLNPWEPPDK